MKVLFVCWIWEATSKEEKTVIRAVEMRLMNNMMLGKKTFAPDGELGRNAECACPLTPQQGNPSVALGFLLGIGLEPARFEG